MLKILTLFFNPKSRNLDEVAKSDLDKLERLAENFERFHSHHETLKEEYEDQYVVIKDRKLRIMTMISND